MPKDAPRSSRGPGLGRWALALALGFGAGAQADEASLELAQREQEMRANIIASVSGSVVILQGLAHRDDAAARPKPTPSEPYPWLRELPETVSGVVLDRDWRILAPAAALRDESGELVDLVDVETSDGEHHLARLIGESADGELALLRLGLFEGQPPAGAPLAPCLKAPRTGEELLVISHPVGPGRFHALGRLASTAPSLSLDVDAHDLARGGAVVSPAGCWQGLVPWHEAGRAPAAMKVWPASKLRESVADMLRRARPRRPSLGIQVQELALMRRRAREEGTSLPPRAPRSGLLVTAVQEFGPADRVGLRAGDYLIGLDEESLFAVRTLQARVFASGQGSSFELVRMRDGKPSRVIVVPAEARWSTATP